MLSDIVANVADYHIDIAKTVGIKRVKIEIVFDHYVAATQVLIFTVVDGFGPFDNVVITSDFGTDNLGKTGSFFINTPTAWYRPGGYDSAYGTQTAFPIRPTNSRDPMADSGICVAGDPTPSPGTTGPTHHPVNKTFAADEFQFVNLNFRSNPRFTYDYTYASEATRLAATGFTDPDDIGKVARQTDTKTAWELLAVNPDTSGVWAIRTSADDKAQIAGGCMFSRPVLIFVAGSADGTYSEDIFQLFPSYTSPDHDWWNNRVSYPSIPAHNAADERLEWIDYGNAFTSSPFVPYDVYSGGYDRSTDPDSEYGPPLGNSVGSFLYRLGTGGNKIGRFLLSIKTTDTKFPQLTAAIQRTIVFHPGFDPARWLTNYSGLPITIQSDFFLYRGLVVLGFNADNTPIIGSTTPDGGSGPLPGTLFQGRWHPTRPDGSDYPHDAVHNPYLNYRQWTETAYHVEGSVKVTFYPS